MKVVVLALVFEAYSEPLKAPVASHTLHGVASKYLVVSMVIEFEHVIF